MAAQDGVHFLDETPAVGIEGVTPYRISHPGPVGLIFGYTTVNEQAIAEASTSWRAW